MHTRANSSGPSSDWATRANAVSPRLKSLDLRSHCASAVVPTLGGKRCASQPCATLTTLVTRRAACSGLSRLSSRRCRRPERSTASTAATLNCCHPWSCHPWHKHTHAVVSGDAVRCSTPPQTHATSRQRVLISTTSAGTWRRARTSAFMYTTTAQKPITAITRAPIFSADKPGSEPYSSPGPNLRCLRRCQRHRANGQCAGWRLPAARPPPPAAAKRGVLGQPPPGLVEALCRSEGQSPPAMRTVRGKEYAPRLVALLARRGPHRATRRCRAYFSVLAPLGQDKIRSDKKK